eukprot:m.497421 g.497421  ORF g.497421 m.497421 type:complete len:254 (-) comp51090_c0_seq1:114-875(-)
MVGHHHQHQGQQHHRHQRQHGGRHHAHVKDVSHVVTEVTTKQAQQVQQAQQPQTMPFEHDAVGTATGLPINSSGGVSSQVVVLAAAGAAVGALLLAALVLCLCRRRWRRLYGTYSPQKLELQHAGFYHRVLHSPSRKVIAYPAFADTAEGGAVMVYGGEGGGEAAGDKRQLMVRAHSNWDSDPFVVAYSPGLQPVKQAFTPMARHQEQGTPEQRIQQQPAPGTQQTARQEGSRPQPLARVFKLENCECREIDL